MAPYGNTHRLSFKDKEITLIGTAHVSRESVDLVRQVIEAEKPDTVCVELCQSRYQSITQKEQWENTNLISVIKEKKAFLLLSHLMLAHFQNKIGRKLGIKPGEEIMQALRSAESVGAGIYLADRDIRVTLSRTWRLMGLWTKVKLLAEFIVSAGQLDAIEQEDIEKMKGRDVLEMLLSEMGKSVPQMKRILIDERDQYLAYKIRTGPGRRIVAVVGAGHIPGIQSYWENSIDSEALMQLPPKRKIFGMIKWAIPAVILGLVVVGFFTKGTAAGTDMIKWWILANAVLAGLGASMALGHPLTVLSAIVSAPLTSLNPMIAAGWVSGLTETLLGKPKVRDFKHLAEDISSLKGFWRNKITRILLVVVFTNLGSSLGTFVAIPLMVKVFA
jgi:pheromone shutdown-related protein TraB